MIAWTADVTALPLELELPPAAPAPPGSAASWVSQGQALRGQGDLPDALAAFNQAEQLSPNNTDARVGMALTYLSQSRTAEARAALDPVRNQAMAQAALGLADLHEGKAEAAEQSLKASLAQNPDFAPARALLALAYLARNDLPDAETAAREAVRRQPNSAQTAGTLAMMLFFAGKTGEAAAARQAVRLNPLSPFALLTEGRSLLARQQSDAARAAYEKAAALAPNLWIAHQELGLVYLRLDMPKKSEEEYHIALRLNPASADAHTGLGLSLSHQGQSAEAEAEHRQAIALDPNNATAHYNLATLLVEQGRLDAARQELEQGVQAAPERGILYARLAEISLYRQDLFAAQEFARRAVRLLPDSALAHYELGRVYLEQERTVQAEQEFRQATTLDRQFASARYALGLTEEKTEGGLLNSFGSLLGSALVGSPASTFSLENLQTPGAEQRIQAALLDPTVVRVASRSYGDAQLDAQGGELGTRDLAGSYLTDTSDGRGVRGVTGEEQATNGVRANADSKRDTASVVVGQKASNSPSGVLLTGDYENSSLGVNDETVAGSETQRFHLHLSHLLAGVNVAAGEHSRLRALVQVSKYLFGLNDLASADTYNKFDIRSVNGEVRWDSALNEVNLFSAGVSLGSRRRLSNASMIFDPSLPPILFVNDFKLQPYQAYVRDEARINSHLTLIGEMQVQRLDTFIHANIIGLPGVSPSQESHQKTFGLPNVILTYVPDTRSAIRFRARRLFATVSDFQLLAPTDVFLVSFAGLPQAASVADIPSSDGTSVEVEYDRTFADASFVRVDAFQQDIRQALIAIGPVGGPYAKGHIHGVQASYEGLLSRDLSFYLSGDVNYTHDSDTGVRIAQVPDFDGLASLQYLNRAGYYAQTAYYYQGNRVAADDDRSHLGGFGVLNLRVGKRFGLRTNIFLELNNALNKTYDVYGILQPSRGLSVGISQRF